jgi:indolepyruvate ferredoxin oxidoreductase beta subunit
MQTFNIYLCGVGGQGVGLLSEVLLRAADHAGLQAKAVDTHGLAQRGGIVVSHLRIGESVFSPMVPKGKADLVVALERHEAKRAAATALRDNGTLIYYNTVLQPLGVRLGHEKEIGEEDLVSYCSGRNIEIITVKSSDISDPRMQNMAVLSHINKNTLVPRVQRQHYAEAMTDLMTGTTLETNLRLFDNG